MYVIGYCVKCRKIKPVRLRAFWRTPVPEGLCRDCEEER